MAADAPTLGADLFAKFHTAEQRKTKNMVRAIVAGAASVLLLASAMLRRRSDSHSQQQRGGLMVRQWRPAAMRPTPLPPVHTYTLVIGAVCDERRHDFRNRLRRLYAPHVASGELLVRFVVSSNRAHDRRWRSREIAANGTGGAIDDLFYTAAATRATMLEKQDCPGHAPGTRKCWSSRTPYREAHCAHKTMGWWQMAGQWSSKWYGKTDDGVRHAEVHGDGARSVHAARHRIPATCHVAHPACVDVQVPYAGQRLWAWRCQCATFVIEAMRMPGARNPMMTAPVCVRSVRARLTLSCADAVIDLPPLFRLLNYELAAINGPVWGGIVHYSSVNTTNLEGSCFAQGGNNAVKFRRKYCRAAEFAGPYPYAAQHPLPPVRPRARRC